MATTDDDGPNLGHPSKPGYQTSKAGHPSPKLGTPSKSVQPKSQVPMVRILQTKFFCKPFILMYSINSARVASASTVEQYRLLSGAGMGQVPIYDDCDWQWSFRPLPVQRVRSVPQDERDEQTAGKASKTSCKGSCHSWKKRFFVKSLHKMVTFTKLFHKKKITNDGFPKYLNYL